MRYRAPEFFKTHGTTFFPGTRVTAIDSAAKKVYIKEGSYTENTEYGITETTEGKGGKTKEYDKLLIATGSKPFVPALEGLDKVPYHGFLTLDDALRLGEALDQRNGKARVLIIGAGLIGMKCAEGIADRTADCTIVEMASRILPAVLDSRAADIVQNHIEAAKPHLKCRLGRSVMSLRYDPAAKTGTAALTDGTTVPFDELVVAVGVRPHTDLAATAGCKINRGVIIDETSATSIPDIYAAGDCTETTDISSGEKRVLAVLPNAYLQGETAGLAMSGDGRSGANAPTGVKFTKAIPLNAAGFFGLHLVTAGSYIGTEIEVPAPHYRKFFTQDDRLKGFIIIGETVRTGIYTALIRDQTPLSSIDFAHIQVSPALMAFSPVQRAEILSGGKP
jgi:NAD(P)H-nitrite reductase large subunit